MSNPSRRSSFLSLLLATLLLTQVGCSREGASWPTNAGAVIEHYADLVHANYADCATQARSMQQAIESFLRRPSVATMQAARRAWLKARAPYGQTEVFRFYSGPIDDDDGPEGLLNAWPMDESYVDGVVGNPNAGIVNDVDNYPKLDEALIVSLNEQEGEENISTGYHAIEFLLWGQDLSETGAGARPFTDYSTAPNAQRRASYLRIVTQRLVNDLDHLVNEWKPDADNYRKQFLALPEREAITNIMNGMGMLSGFELARERLDVPYQTKLQEDEHSCFSDNTHDDAYRNAQGIQNVFTGEYAGSDGQRTSGPGVGAFLTEIDADMSTTLSEQIAASVGLAQGLQPPFDRLIVESNTTGRASIQALIDALTTQAQSLSEAATRAGLKINIEE
ncbi:MAG: imelysin family protein [Acidobacteriota bacterium]